MIVLDKGYAWYACEKENQGFPPLGFFKAIQAAKHPYKDRDGIRWEQIRKRTRKYALTVNKKEGKAGNQVIEIHGWPDKSLDGTKILMMHLDGITKLQRELKARGLPDSEALEIYTAWAKKSRHI